VDGGTAYRVVAGVNHRTRRVPAVIEGAGPLSDGLDDCREDDSNDVGGDVSQLVYGSVDEFVRERLRHMYTRPVGCGNATTDGRLPGGDIGKQSLVSRPSGERGNTSPGRSHLSKRVVAEYVDHHMPIPAWSVRTLKGPVRTRRTAAICGAAYGLVPRILHVRSPGSAPTVYLSGLASANKR
jgi:hypothetical protein